tara:strand:+ start:1076 stop:1234 length:159 start_codon:yes stop_codon:yes gene_type:complete
VVGTACPANNAGAKHEDRVDQTRVQFFPAKGTTKPLGTPTINANHSVLTCPT